MYQLLKKDANSWEYRLKNLCIMSTDFLPTSYAFRIYFFFVKFLVSISKSLVCHMYQRFVRAPCCIIHGNKMKVERQAIAFVS